MNWLLEDKPVECGNCEGTGMWTNPYKPKDKRKCYTCDGKGVLR